MQRKIVKIEITDFELFRAIIAVQEGADLGDGIRVVKVQDYGNSQRNDINVHHIASIIFEYADHIVTMIEVGDLINRLRKHLRDKNENPDNG